MFLKHRSKGPRRPEFSSSPRRDLGPFPIFGVSDLLYPLPHPMSPLEKELHGGRSLGLSFCSGGLKMQVLGRGLASQRPV